MDSALLFVVHGSKNPQYHRHLQQLHRNIRRHFPQLTFDIAPLEFGDRPLGEMLLAMGQGLGYQGQKRLKIVPLFLGAGVHTQEDLPAAVDFAQPQLPNFQLEVLPFLGNWPTMATTLGRQFRHPPSPHHQRILLAHGSGRPGGNEAIETLTIALQAQPLYWSVAPKYDHHLHHLPPELETVEILPYFLFPGKITQAIAQEINQFNENPEKKPRPVVHLGDTLAEGDSLIELLDLEVVARIAPIYPGETGGRSE